MKTIVITGASSGIGRAAAKELTAMGHTVVVVGRDLERTKKVAAECNANYFTADFAKLSDVRRLADDLLDKYPKIDVLANNAGGIFSRDRRVTEDGNEVTFQVNHLGGFLLTELLKDRLAESCGVVINTSSIAHEKLADFDINDLQNENNYSPEKAYGNAKLCNILHINGVRDHYYASRGIRCAAYHPGIVRTEFSAHSGSIMKLLYKTPLKYALASPKKGADTLVWLASSEPDYEWYCGAYFADRKPVSAAKITSDKEIAQKLWDYSLKAVGL